MIRLLFCFVFFFHITIMQAQKADKKDEMIQYLFPVFTLGTVQLKTEGTRQAMLNYNLYSEEIIFENKGERLALDNIEDVDTVFIGDKKLIPVGKRFYEVVAIAPVPLLIQHLFKIIPPGSDLGYGGLVQQTANSKVERLGPARIYLLDLPPGYEAKKEVQYWLKKDNRFVKVSGINQFEKMFPRKKGQIKDYIKENNIKWNQKEDMAKLTLFCNE